MPCSLLFLLSFEHSLLSSPRYLDSTVHIFIPLFAITLFCSFIYCTIRWSNDFWFISSYFEYLILWYPLSVFLLRLHPVSLNPDDPMNDYLSQIRVHRRSLLSPDIVLHSFLTLKMLLFHCIFQTVLLSLLYCFYVVRHLTLSLSFFLFGSTFGLSCRSLLCPMAHQMEYLYWLI